MGRDVGMRLRHARKLRGLTQAKLAELTGIPQASISEVETGESKSLSGTNLVKAAQKLKVSPDWLATGKGPMEPIDTPLSPEAIKVARNWEKLDREVASKIADMIQQLADTAEALGKPAPDEKVEAAYGRPGQPAKRK